MSFSTHPEDEKTLIENALNSPSIPPPSPPEPPSPNPPPPPPQLLNVPDLPPNPPDTGNAMDYPGSPAGPLDGHSLILMGDDNTISSINTDYHTLHMRAQGKDPEIQNGGYREPDSPTGTPQRAQQYQSRSPNPETAQLPRSVDIRTSRSPAKEESKPEEEGSCLPQWLVDAPFWLKLVIVTSTALLLGAMVLIGVAASLEVQSREDAAQNNAAVSPPSPTTPGNSFPTQPNMAPTSIPLTADPTAAPIEEMPPWQPYNTSTSVQFFVAGGRFAGEDLAKLPEELSKLPNIDGNTVFFHLGDWNSPSLTRCEEFAYSDIANLFMNCSLPVYFIVGDNEFNGRSNEWRM